MARKPKLDTILVEAVDTARASLAEISSQEEVGEYLGATIEGERLVTHRFVSLKKGYRGWTWFATIARVPRAKAKDITVCEVGLVAGEDSLLAPPWVPWADRLAKEEIEAAQAAENTDSGEASSDEETADAASTDESGDADTVQSADAPLVDEPQGEPVADSVESAEEVEAPKTQARRQVRRRRTAQRTAARRRAAQRNRARKDG